MKALEDICSRISKTKDKVECNFSKKDQNEAPVKINGQQIPYSDCFVI